MVSKQVSVHGFRHGANPTHHVIINILNSFCMISEDLGVTAILPAEV